jgi:hypothetical protein
MGDLVFKTSPNGHVPPAAVEPDWSGWEKWIASHLEMQHEVVLEIMGQALAEERQRARREVADTMKELRGEFDALRNEISGLRTLLTSERKFDGLSRELSDQRVEAVELKHALRTLAESLAGIQQRLGLA